MQLLFVLFFVAIPLFLAADFPRSVLDELALVHQIDAGLKDRLPFFYNESLMGGYYNMPSARMEPAGMVSIGGGRVPPYNIYGINVQPFDHIELSGNYRVFTGITEGNFGHEGFGDDAERIGNVKIALLLPEDGYSLLPSIAIGADDFIGTKRFNSQYIVATKEWTRANLEISLGFGRKRLKGVFGGLAWTPFRKSGVPFFKDLSLLAEYDGYNYKKHFYEHPGGRSVKSRINIGVTYLLGDTFQLNVHSVRGERIAGSASLRYPLGTTQGFFPKIDDAEIYTSPIDTQAIGPLRSLKELAQEFAYGFADEGLDLYSAYVSYGPKGQKRLWLKVVNNRYRELQDVRIRLQHFLAATLPSDVDEVIVVTEADALPVQSYYFRKEDLDHYRLGFISDFEMATLSPLREAPPSPSDYDSTLIFHRRKKIWTFTVRPRLLTFFGSTKGKFKYNVSAIAAPEGYLFDEIYYKLQAAYSIKSSINNLSGMDRLNPSKLPMVRTDSLRYFHSNTASLEQAFVQKGWNMKKGLFSRLALGYFEPAYGGIAAEMLYYPVTSNWAVGIEAANVLKRRYEGIAFTKKIGRFKHHKLTHEHFIGLQYFLDVYYDFKPLSLQFKVTIGQFLAKDKGVRTEVVRYFRSGMRFGLWCTVTNGHDKVNGKTYYDKGFSFSIPLDFFMKQSSRNFIGYAMSAWLRDVGAQADTGKPLFSTIWEERH